MLLKSAVTWMLFATVAILGTAGCSSIERGLLFFPSHRVHNNSLSTWTRNGEIIGYARIVESPRNIWLLLHGNAGWQSGIPEVLSFNACVLFKKIPD